MKIDFANLSLSYSKHKSEFDAAVLSVMADSNFIMGQPVKELESKLSDFTGSTHAISCSSGTDAILLALLCLDIQPGDEVITSPFTFIATAEMIALLRAVPVFVDIDPVTFNIDVSKLENKITSKTKAIMPVSLYGQMADMNSINIIASKHNIPVIEDAAQSFGATSNNVQSCNASTFGCTSFFPAKPLGCFGDGGAVFTQDKVYAQKLDSLRLHGQTKRYHHKHIGIGGRLDTLQAAVLLVKLKYYQKDIEARQSVAKKYTELLEDKVSVPIIKEQNTSVWAQYSVRVNNRDSVQKKLILTGIPTAVHYPKPLHLQECFEYLGYNKGDFPVSEEVSNEIMSLPMNPYLKDEEIEYISETLKNIIQR